MHVNILSVKQILKLSIETHSYNPGILEAKEGRFQVQGQPVLYNKSLSQEKKKKQTEKFTPIIPVLRRQRQKGSGVHGYSQLYSLLQAWDT